MLHAPGGYRVAIAPGAGLSSLGRVIPRLQLDQALVEHAVSHGARLLQETRALGASSDARGITVHCRREKQRFAIQAQITLAGDGAVATFSRHAGLVQSGPQGVAARLYVQGRQPTRPAYHVFFLQDVSSGYGWVFPSGDGRYNVGLGMWLPDLKRKKLGLKSSLRAFLARPDVQALLGPRYEPGAMQGHPLRVSTLTNRRLCGPRRLALGDAAGLMHPLSGEGIAPALESGLLAAEHTLRAFNAGDFTARALAPYAAAVRARYAWDYRAALVLQFLMRSNFMANRILDLGRREPEFARMLGRAVLAQSSTQLLAPSTFFKLFVRWPLRHARKALLRR